MIILLISVFVAIYAALGIGHMISFYMTILLLKEENPDANPEVTNEIHLKLFGSEVLSTENKNLSLFLLVFMWPAILVNYYVEEDEFPGPDGDGGEPVPVTHLEEKNSTLNGVKKAA